MLNKSLKVKFEIKYATILKATLSKKLMEMLKVNLNWNVTCSLMKMAITFFTILSTKMIPNMEASNSKPKDLQEVVIE